MKTILCYGDSNTYGYDPLSGLRYPRDVRWPGKLQQLLGPDYTVIEEGCNGRTTVFVDPAEGWKNGKDYLKPCLNSHKPVDLVVMMLGSNDLKKIYHVTARESAQGAEELVRIIRDFTREKQGFEARVLLVSPPEVGPGVEDSPFSYAFDGTAPARSREFAEEFRKAADAQGCLFLDAARWVRPSEADSLHLTPEAHAVLAEQVRRKIAEAFP